MKTAPASRFARVSGDLAIIGTWAETDGRGRFEPCLVVTQAGNKERDERCIVQLQDAWIWNGVLGDPAAAARHAYDFTIALGWDPTVERVRFVYDAVRAAIPELLIIPPYRKDA